MTPIININTTVIQSLPFSKRLTKWILFVQSVCYPIKWLYTNVLSGFMNGSTPANYNASTNYNSGTQVIYNFGVWESTVGGNINNQPNYVPIYSSVTAYAVGFCVLYGGTYYQCNTPITSEPFDPEHWTALIQAPWINVNGSFIGTTEQANYTGNYLTLTWALNRYFQTTFRQPPYPAPYDFGESGGVWSEIYIVNSIPPYVSFAVGTVGQPLGGISTYPLTIGFGTTAIIGTASPFAFTINIPVAVYNALGATDPIRLSIVNRFVSNYAPCGLSWSVATY